MTLQSEGQTPKWSNTDHTTFLSEAGQTFLTHLFILIHDPTRRKGRWLWFPKVTHILQWMSGPFLLFFFQGMVFSPLVVFSCHTLKDWVDSGGVHLQHNPGQSNLIWLKDTADWTDQLRGQLYRFTSASQISHFQMSTCLHPWCWTLGGTERLVDPAPPGTSLCKWSQSRATQQPINKSSEVSLETDIPVSSLNVSSILVWSGELPPMNSVFTSRSSSSRWSISFCKDFLNQGPLSWSERRSGMGKRTAIPSTGALTVTVTWQLVGVRLSSRKTSVKALCCEICVERQRWRLNAMF